MKLPYSILFPCLTLASCHGQRLKRKGLLSGLLIAVGLLCALVPLGAVADEQADKEYLDKIRPILQKKCFECHDNATAKADLNLEFFQDVVAVQDAREIWQEVFQRVQAFEMPPKKAPELSFNEHQTLMKWLRQLPKPEQADCDQLASDRTANFYRGYVMSRRLNRAEYLNTVRDLTGVELDATDILPADGGGGEGFDTTGSALFTSTIHVEKYVQAAETILKQALPDSLLQQRLSSNPTDPAQYSDVEAAEDSSAPIRPTTERSHDPSPSEVAPLHFASTRPHLILSVVPGPNLAPRDAASQVIQRFARRAFRRPVAEEEFERFVQLFDRVWVRGDGFMPALRYALTGVLISPHFLFLAEPEPEQAGIQPLGAVPLASKLSYFLWSTQPDEELLSLAENGELLKPEIYQAQIHRMLTDPKASALGERFALQWLDLDRLGTDIRPDPKAFPEFNDELGEAMRAEVVAYFNHILREDRSLLELIDSDYTLVTRRMADWYAVPESRRTLIEAVQGDHPLRSEHSPDLDQWVRVSWEDRRRGGLTSMAAVHTLTSYPLRTSPVLRGRWILESLLGDRVPPPPPDVPALDEEAEVDSSLSLREQLELHRAQAECAACHDKMDPLGFGLENFDALGRWRDTDRGQPIDARGELPGGTSFSGPDGLKELLMSRKDQILRHMVKKLTGYAFGRELNKFDDCVVDRAMERMELEGYRPSLLMEEIAGSFPFKHRYYPQPE